MSSIELCIIEEQRVVLECAELWIKIVIGKHFELDSIKT